MVVKLGNKNMLKPLLFFVFVILLIVMSPIFFSKTEAAGDRMISRGIALGSLIIPGGAFFLILILFFGAALAFGMSKMMGDT